ARRIVAIAITDVRAGYVDFHVDGSPAAVAFHIAAQTVADQVVSGIVLLNLRERLTQIPQIKERFSAGISGKSGERVSRIVALVGLMKNKRAGKQGSSGGRVRSCVASRRGRKQATRVDRIDR